MAPLPPDWLTQAQRDAWCHAVARIPRELSAIDESVLAAYVIAEDQHRTAARQQAQIDGGTALKLLTKDKSGRPVASPYLAVMERAAAQMIKAASALGLRQTARPAIPTQGAAAEDDADELAATVSKRELCLILRISRPTLDAWIDRYGDAFPILERGANGREYRFDPEAVTAFLRDRQAEDANRRAERDQQLAQLMLPLPDQRPDSAIVSLDDQIKAARLNAMRLAEAERARQLVPAAEVADHLGSIFAALNRNLAAFVRQIGREHAWPEPIIRATEDRLAEVQRAAVREATASLTPEPDAPRLALA